MTIQSAPISDTATACAPPPDVPPAATGPERLSIEEFRRRHAAGTLSLARWDRFCIARETCRLPAGDPHDRAYADAVMATWRAISGRPEYAPEQDEVFPLDGTHYLERPFPYSSGSPTTVSHYFGIVAATVDRMGTPPPARVIEYGAGWGHMSLALAATGYRVTAVDVNPDSVALLRRRSAALQVPLDVVHAPFLGYEPDGPVDAIVFFEAFHHCDRPFELLDRCAAQLGPRGRIVFVADAFYDDFYVPWGMRLDGAAAFVTAAHGWLELGFDRAFFSEELRARGFRVSWETLPWLGAYGTVLTAERP